MESGSLGQASSPNLRRVSSLAKGMKEKAPQQQWKTLRGK